jgi:hypothetical protein
MNRQTDRCAHHTHQYCTDLCERKEPDREGREIATSLATLTAMTISALSKEGTWSDSPDHGVRLAPHQRPPQLACGLVSVISSTSIARPYPVVHTHPSDGAGEAENGKSWRGIFPSRVICPARIFLNPKRPHGHWRAHIPGHE